MQNKLYGKTILWDGDSICAGRDNHGNWSTRIAQRNAMQSANYAVGGGTITEKMKPMANGEPRHSVCGTVDQMYAEHPDADYIIIEGGTNDADLMRAEQPSRLGAFDPHDFSGNYDTSTFCGALESIFYRAIQYWCGQKIAYVIPQKMCYGEPASYENRRFFFDKAVEICKKWGIPYCDLWYGCYLDSRLPWMYDSTKSADENRLTNNGFYYDGQHLTARGYDFTTDILDSWLKTL